MATENLELQSPLWRFALELWGNSAIQGLCLEMQQQGWNVTQILVALWLAHLGCRYDREMDAAPAKWRREKTQVLRDLRRSLHKTDPTTAALREKIASAELEAERVELGMAYKAAVTAAPSNENLETILRQNLSAAAPDGIGLMDSEDAAADFLTALTSLATEGRT